MKRFTETEKWNDPWFRKLPGVHKLTFLFLIENCNNAGFYELDLPHMAYLMNIKEDLLEGAIKGLSRGITEASGWVWIHNFLRHQKNSELNWENLAHRQIVGLLRSQMGRFGETEVFSEFIAPYKELLSPIGIGKGKEVRVESAERREMFSSPSVEEVQKHGIEIGVDPSECLAFFDFYESKDWMVGKNKMKKWKSALSGWKRRSEAPAQAVRPYLEKEKAPNAC